MRGSGIAPVVALLLGLASLPVIGQPSPRLQIQIESSGLVRISFPSGGAYQLEETTSLPSNRWTPVSKVPNPAGNNLEVRLPVDTQTRFFRLAAAPLAGIALTSPADGEQDVAVTRETIVRFSAPLGADTMLKTNN